MDRYTILDCQPSQSSCNRGQAKTRSQRTRSIELQVLLISLGGRRSNLFYISLDCIDYGNSRLHYIKTKQKVHQAVLKWNIFIGIVFYSLQQLFPIYLHLFQLLTQFLKIGTWCFLACIWLPFWILLFYSTVEITSAVPRSYTKDNSSDLRENPCEFCSEQLFSEGENSRIKHEMIETNQKKEKNIRSNDIERVFEHDTD